MKYDVAIIGSGPAGMSAALTLNLHNKNIIWFGSKDLSDKVEKSEIIANYPGFGRVGGHDLNAEFKKQIESEGLEITDKKVTNIGGSPGNFMVLADNDIYESKSVLLCTGAVTGKGFENEDRLLGRGVSYCATCDGFLYKGKTIAVFCASRRFEHEVVYLSEMAQKVYLFCSYKDSEVNEKNIERLLSPIKSINGENKVESIGLINGEVINIDGIFMLREAVNPTSLVIGIEMDGAHILVDKNAKTNMDGIFAAGDCTGRPYQITPAMGEGNVAAHSIVEWLVSYEKERGA